MKRATHIIDAANQSIGRLASVIAVLLTGKHKADFMPNKDMGDLVVVENIGKVKFTGRKLNQKVYYRHSGYPGGIKTAPLKKLFKEKPQEVLKKAVLGMLPKNRLRAQRIKRLSFK